MNCRWKENVFVAEQGSNNTKPLGPISVLQRSVLSFSFAAAFSCRVGPLPAPCLEIQKKLPIDALWIYVNCWKTCQVILCFPVTVLLGFCWFAYKDGKYKYDFKVVVSSFYICGRHKAKGEKVYIDCVFSGMFFSVVLIYFFKPLVVWLSASRMAWSMFSHFNHRSIVFNIAGSPGSIWSEIHIFIALLLAFQSCQERGLYVVWMFV